ncbi:MAG: hypothetical protein KGD59_01165 [Candidatus Heimdallarchaeota archaeon]|nr:hypothetical protein [Candidatus Heimdallarchaeota archaeon]MBY8993129.1 hypothetical protein [Candidatus Heimdallarchaeota archaeon]
MALSDDIVQRLDDSRVILEKVYEKLDPENYTKAYKDIWKVRSEIEFIVISLKLLNNLEENEIGVKWKEEFSQTLKQVRSESKIRQVFLETFDLYNKLERIENIIEFYRICWKLKEKLTILLNVVKPKHKRSQESESKIKKSKSS